MPNQEEESKKLLTVIRNLDDFSSKISKNLDSHTFEEKRSIVKFLIEQVEVDTMHDIINVKHIIPSPSEFQEQQDCHILHLGVEEPNDKQHHTYAGPPQR